MTLNGIVIVVYVYVLTGMQVSHQDAGRKSVQSEKQDKC
jgi:hypothetical protein